MKNKIFLFILTVLSIFSLASCGKKKDKTTENTNQTTTKENTTIENHNHVFNKEVASNEYLKTPATCTESAVYFKSCSCGEKGEETFTYGSPLGHNWNETEWHYNNDQHYHFCENCDAKKDLTNHTLEEVIDQGATYTADGLHHYKCIYCDYESKQSTIPAKEKEMPEYTKPTGLTAKYGDTLSSVTLPDGFSFNDTPTTSVGNVGNNTFLVSYTVPNDTISRYKTVDDIEVTITVEKKEQSLVFDLSTSTFEYGSITLITENDYVHEGSGTIKIEYRENTSTSEYSETIPTNIGEYWVRVTANETPTENSAEIETIISITKINQVITINNISRTYNGSAIDPTDEYEYNGDGAVTITYKKTSEPDSAYTTTAPTNVGEYIIKISVAESSYHFSGSKTKQFSITPATPTIIDNPAQTSTNYIGQTLDSVSFTASANVDGEFHFADNTLKLTSTSAKFYVVFVPDDETNYEKIENIEITIIATQLKVTVNVGDHGTSNRAGENNVDYGSNFSVTFGFDANYSISSLTLDGTEVDPSSSYTIENVTSDHTISVSFAYHESSYTLTVDKDGSGTIKLEDFTTDETIDSASGNYTIAYNDRLYFTIKPSEGYYIYKVKNGGNEYALTNDRYEYFIDIMMQSNITISVEFKVEPTITINLGEHGKANTKNNGTGTDMSGETTVEYYSNLTFYIIADENYYIVGEGGSNTKQITLNHITEDHSYSYEFALLPKITYSTTGNGSIHVASNSTSDEVADGFVNYNSNKTVYVIPDENHYISSIKINDEAQEISLENRNASYYALSISSIKENKNIIVTFAEKPKITVMYDNTYVTMHLDGSWIKQNTYRYFDYGYDAVVALQSEFINEAKVFDKVYINGVNEVNAYDSSSVSYTFTDITEDILVQVVVADRLFHVTLPETQTGYTLVTDKDSYKYNETVTLMFELDKGYSRCTTYRFIVGNNYVYASNFDSDGNYTFTITKDIEVTADGFTMNKCEFKSFYRGSYSYTSDEVIIKYESEKEDSSAYLYGDNFTIKYKFSDEFKNIYTFASTSTFEYNDTSDNEIKSVALSTISTFEDGWYVITGKLSNYGYADLVRIYLYPEEQIQEVTYVVDGLLGTTSYMYLKNTENQYNHTLNGHSENVYTNNSAVIYFYFDDTVFVDEIRINDELFTGDIDIHTGYVMINAPICITSDGKTTISVYYTSESKYQIRVINSRHDIEISTDISNPLVSSGEEVTVTVTPNTTDLIVTMVSDKGKVVNGNTITYIPTESERWTVYFKEPSVNAVHIKTASQLQNIKNNIDGYYIIDNNIDMSDFVFETITEFTGTIVGNGWTISNLNIIGELNAHFIKNVNAASITNLKFNNIDITATDTSSSAFASIFDIVTASTISDITIDGDSEVKGKMASFFIGDIYYSTISNIEIWNEENYELKVIGNNASSFAITINNSKVSNVNIFVDEYTYDALGSYMVGFARAISNNSVITKCNTEGRMYATCGEKVVILGNTKLTNTRIVGFADQIIDSKIELSSSTHSSVKATISNIINYVGFASYVSNSEILNCYSLNDVTITGEFGHTDGTYPYTSFISGFVLIADDHSSISYCYTGGNIDLVLNGNPSIDYSEINVYRFISNLDTNSTINNSFDCLELSISRDSELTGEFERTIKYYVGANCDETSSVNDKFFYIDEDITLTNTAGTNYTKYVKSGTEKSKNDVIDKYYDEENGEYIITVFNICEFDEDIWWFNGYPYIDIDED